MDAKAFAQQKKNELITCRRDLHQHPEPGWTEYRTASIVASTLEKLGYDLVVGEEVLKMDARMGLPSEEEMRHAMDRAIQEGADPKWVEKFGYGRTALVAAMKFSSDGPVVAFRSDMDSNDVVESADADHRPNELGFASLHPGAMHACGHDSHVTMALGLAEYIAQNKAHYKGTIKLIFQPAEEGVRGARAMAEAGVVDDVDVFFGLHIGMSSALSNCLACMTPGFLATTKLDAEFTGYSSHAGGAPERGRNAMLAACTAVLNLEGISRHSGGASRINVGVLQSGTGRNVIPDKAFLKIETRGASTAINDYVRERALQVLEGSAVTQDVTVKISEAGSAPCVTNSEDLAETVHKIAEELAIFRRVDMIYNGGGSEDCAYFMEQVINHGGKATYMILGSAIAGPHHNPRFDIDEEDMPNGVILMGTLADYFLTK